MNTTQPKPAWWIALCVLILAAGFFSVRGVYRGLNSAGDLGVIHASVSVWLTGGNPYDYDETRTRYLADGGDPTNRDNENAFLALYPPTIYPILSPLGAMPWPAAKMVATFLSIAALLGSIYLLCERLKLQPPRRWMLLAAGLIFGPAITAIAMGQLTLWSLFGLLLAWRWIDRGRWLLGGIVLGLAVGLKPQLVGGFALLLAFARQPRSFGMVMATGLVLSVVAVGRMTISDIPWFATLTQNLENFQFGGHGDPTAANPNRHLLLELPVLLHLWINDRSIVSILSFVLVAPPVIATIVRTWQERRIDILSGATILTASLLPVYHRFYDAVVLLVAVAWVVTSFDTKHKTRFRWWLTTACLCLMAMPHTGVILKIFLQPRLPETWANTTLWLGLGLYHQVWVTLLLCYLLAWACWREPQS